jgi:hypothetical protein
MVDGVDSAANRSRTRLAPEAPPRSVGRSSTTEQREDRAADAAAGDSFQRQAVPSSAVQLAQMQPPASRADIGSGRIGATRALANTGARNPGGSPPLNDNILFLGFHPTAKSEASELARRSGQQVTLIGQSPKEGTIESGGHSYDLADIRGIDAFTRTLGRPEEQRAKIADALLGTQPAARDEMARVAQVWSAAERGESIPSRMVISGHNDADGLWGDHNGEITPQNLRDLAAAMPKAASMVEDLHLAACNSGGKTGLDQWKSAFPNLKTLWAYHDSAPGANKGSAAHLALWEKATRGRADSLDPAIAAGTRYGENVDTWSLRGGYRTPAEDLMVAQERYDATRSAAEPYLSGRQEVQDSQSGPLRDHYRAIQSLLRNPATSEDRDRLSRERDSALRMLYYRTNVAPAFQRAYGKELEGGYRALGRAQPDFSRLSRQQGLDEVRAFEEQAAKSSAPVQSTLRLLRGLRDLDPAIIPRSWI